MVSVQFILWLNQSVLPVIFLSGQRRNFILYVFVGELCMEHFFFLVNKLLHVEVAGLFRKLHTGSSNVQCSSNCFFLLLIVAIRCYSFVLSILTLRILVIVCRLYIRVFNSSQRCSRSSCVFVPDLLILQLFFSFLFLRFLGLSGYKHLLIVWGFEWGPLILIFHEGIRTLVCRH